MFTLYFICRENELEKFLCSTFDDDAARDIFILRYADDDVLSLLFFFSTAAAAALSSATTRVVERRLFFFRVEKKSFDEECDEFSSRNDQRQKSVRRNTLCAIETTTERLIGFSDEKRRESRR